MFYLLVLHQRLRHGIQGPVTKEAHRHVKIKKNISGKSAQTSGKTFLPDVHHTYFLSIFCTNIYSNNKYIQMSQIYLGQ